MCQFLCLGLIVGFIPYSDHSEIRNFRYDWIWMGLEKTQAGLFFTDLSTGPAGLYPSWYRPNDGVNTWCGMINQYDEVEDHSCDDLLPFICMADGNCLFRS